MELNYQLFYFQFLARAEKHKNVLFYLSKYKSWVFTSLLTSSCNISLNSHYCSFRFLVCLSGLSHLGARHIQKYIRALLWPICQSITNKETDNQSHTWLRQSHPQVCVMSWHREDYSYREEK